MLSSFEKTTEVLYDSAFYHQIDPLKGVSEAIILGKQIPLGTNSFDLFLDNGMLNKQQQTHKSDQFLFKEVFYQND